VTVLCQLNCIISKVSLFCTTGVAGILETSSIGKRRRPGCDPVGRLPGQVGQQGPWRNPLGWAAHDAFFSLRGFFCRTLSGSLFWRTSPSMLWPPRCHFLQTLSMAGILWTGPIGEGCRPGCDSAMHRPARRAQDSHLGRRAGEASKKSWGPHPSPLWCASLWRALTRMDVAPLQRAPGGTWVHSHVGSPRPPSAQPSEHRSRVTHLRSESRDSESPDWAGIGVEPLVSMNALTH